MTDTRLPIPDWDLIAEGDAADASAAAHDAYWTSAAGHWLVAMQDALGDGYRVDASDDFLLLSDLPQREVEVFFAFCQSVRRRIARNLGELAMPREGGKHVVLVFADGDAYYDYIGHYFPEGGEFAMSSGMFVHGGYGHFALTRGEMEHMQPVIAHELTHCLVAHLPIPAWVNEGMAVHTEHALFPHVAHQLYFPQELQARHVAFWNADTIQEFWSGKSFLRVDEGNELSYDLAKRLTTLAVRNEGAYRAFVRHANRSDGGVSAQDHLGYPVHHLIHAVLGEGDWTPRPAQWRDSVEGGQF